MDLPTGLFVKNYTPTSVVLNKITGRNTKDLMFKLLQNVKLRLQGTVELISEFAFQNEGFKQIEINHFIAINRTFLVRPTFELLF